MKFKKGDRVRYKFNAEDGAHPTFGDVGTVEDTAHNGYVTVRFDFQDRKELPWLTWLITPTSLELVEE